MLSASGSTRTSRRTRSSPRAPSRTGRRRRRAGRRSTRAGDVVAGDDAADALVRSRRRATPRARSPCRRGARSRRRRGAGRSRRPDGQLVARLAEPGQPHHVLPPSRPVRIAASASRCSSLPRSSTWTTKLPRRPRLVVVVPDRERDGQPAEVDPVGLALPDEPGEDAEADPVRRAAAGTSPTVRHGQIASQLHDSK